MRFQIAETEAPCGGKKMFDGQYPISSLANGRTSLALSFKKHVLGQRTETFAILKKNNAGIRGRGLYLDRADLARMQTFS